MARGRASLLDYLRTVPDFRRAQGRRYPLAETLCMVVMGIMSGYCGYREIGRFIRYNQQDLVTFLKLQRQQLPSYVTIRQVLMHVDFTALSAAFRCWVAAMGAGLTGRWLSIDGKSLKSTVSEYDKAQQNFVVLVSAFCQQTGMVEAVARFENGKQSEISSVWELLGRLQERGLLLTLDALHCQKKQSPSLSSSGSII
ncbi:ISAs1 family transposase [Adhaeribacter rhizoryzae]|uniref:ISAs1 family transposase n=1 Tax=Adhaeribacter rhizoryzae TaxID=2607907 RepID=A0A5M6DSG8_9BACT|nr:ISAs1 family transposase [Adhaeribacter rhizoryzae]KAA5549256.1 ISAs1 family transposase [Adhaeribacter rhizoryzae]